MPAAAPTTTALDTERLTATTHEACQADLEATLAELSSAPFVAEVHHVNRVEES